MSHERPTLSASGRWGTSNTLSAVGECSWQGPGLSTGPGRAGLSRAGASGMGTQGRQVSSFRSPCLSWRYQEHLAEAWLARASASRASRRGGGRGGWAGCLVSRSALPDWLRDLHPQLLSAGFVSGASVSPA